MNRAAWVGLLVGLVIIAALAWWLRGSDDAADREGATAVDYTYPEIDAPDEDALATPRYPLPEAKREAVAAAEPLPELEASDDAVRSEATALPGAAPLEALLVPERLIERFVVSLNNLDSAQMAPLRMWPLRHAEGVPEIAREGEERFRWKPANQSRYDAYVKAFTAPDAETWVALYLRYYPLLQEAYEALGEQEPYFNDRVIAIIDHLLEAPEARASYALRQPEVLFTFADPELEQLSAGQKLLLRLGPGHSAAVRAQLRAIRAEIVARTGSEDEGEDEG